MLMWEARLDAYVGGAPRCICGRRASMHMWEARLDAYVGGALKERRGREFAVTTMGMKSQLTKLPDLLAAKR